MEIIELDTLDNSKVPSGSVLVKVKRSGTLGSDMPMFATEFKKSQYPFLPVLSIRKCIDTIAITDSKGIKEGDEALSLPYHDLGLTDYFLSYKDQTVFLPHFKHKETIFIYIEQPGGKEDHCPWQTRLQVRRIKKDASNPYNKCG